MLTMGYSRKDPNWGRDWGHEEIFRGIVGEIACGNSKDQSSTRKKWNFQGYQKIKRIKKRKIIIMINK